MKRACFFYILASKFIEAVKVSIHYQKISKILLIVKVLIGAYLFGVFVFDYPHALGEKSFFTQGIFLWSFFLIVFAYLLLKKLRPRKGD